MKKRLFIIMFIAAIGLHLLLRYLMVRKAEKTVAAYSFSGIITDSYLNESDHRAPMIIVNGRLRVKTFSYQLYKYAHKGDSISKTRGTSEYILIKNKKSIIIKSKNIGAYIIY